MDKEKIVIVKKLDKEDVDDLKVHKTDKIWMDTVLELGGNVVYLEDLEIECK